MARPQKLTPDQVEVIRELRRSGVTAADIARETGTPLRSVQRALSGPDATAPPAEEPLDTTPTLAALGVESAITGRDPLEIATAAVARTDALARAEADAGNVSGYVALLRQQTLLVTACRQLEAQRANTDTRDVVTFTRQELEDGARLVRERLAALEADRIANGGMTCIRCGEALRLADAETNGNLVTER